MYLRYRGYGASIERRRGAGFSQGMSRAKAKLGWIPHRLPHVRRGNEGDGLQQIQYVAVIDHFTYDRPILLNDQLGGLIVRTFW
jgi:hypothetical protein